MGINSILACVHYKMVILTYPETFPFGRHYVWEYDKAIKGFAPGPWGKVLFHSSVCEEEAREIADGSASCSQSGIVYFGVGIEEYIFLHLPCAEGVARVLELVRNAAKPVSVDTSKHE